MYEIPRLEKTKLWKDVENHLAPIAKKRFKIEEGKKLKFTKKEEYIASTFFLLSEISNKFKDLDACIAFISSYPKKSAIGKLLARSEYLFYHIEFYCINVVGIFDRALKLINHIFNLGLADKHVSLDVILNNSNVPQKVKKILKDYDKGISNIRTLQNNFKHKSKYSDDKLKNAIIFEGFERIDSLHKEMSVNDMKKFEIFTKIEYSSYIREKKKDFKNNNKTMVNILSAVYKEIYPSYRETLNQMK